MRLLDNPSEFFESCYEAVFRLVARTTGAPRAILEDFVHETLLHAWQARASYRGESDQLTWILGIARNKLRDSWRRDAARSRREVVIGQLRALEKEFIPDEILESHEMRAQVRRALDVLPPSYADVLMRRYFDGASVRHIAAALRETEKSIEARLHRAREAFRQELAASGGDDVDG
ncbi:MAG: sigma-70 family RNA polymerase sigma factor [Planctomycetes bacterium]|nr:sigma-70 family RNA polymerase sigma factor [Planctomycetota bacterium]